MTPEQEQKLNEVYEVIQQLRSASALPFDIREALSDALVGSSLSTSSKVSTSENQAVDEAGSGTYSVLKPPDGFLQISIDGTTYYLPMYT